MAFFGERAGVARLKVFVLGAGLLGVASAWYLRQAGHEVTVIDRQPGVALETSFANGGQISTSHAEPWANPEAPAKIISMLGREDAPLLWRFRADPAQWAWGLKFLLECTPGRTHRNTLAILRLALYSRQALQELRSALSLEYAQKTLGILHFYTDDIELRHAQAQAELLTQYGCERLVKSAAECLAIEPALANSQVPILGGTYTPGDESGDAHRFTEQLAERAAALGVEFKFNSQVTGLQVAGDRVEAVMLADQSPLSVGDGSVVVALGSYSAPVLRSIGMRLPVYPVKGYSVTIPVSAQAMAAMAPVAPCVSLTDESHKIVFSRLDDKLRVAGTAEFNGYNTELNLVRSNAILQRVLSIFPKVTDDISAVEHWSGLRPASPNNVPLVGKARFDNLFLNTGHGTLGWTMACGSGRLLADLIAGRQPDVDPAPYSLYSSSTK